MCRPMPRLPQVLKEHRITFALLDLGGNIQAVGSKQDGSSWRLGLRNPFSEGTLGALEISNQAVAPPTGYPAESGLASAI